MSATDPQAAANAAEPLTAAELAELAASIDHLSGSDAWDEDRLEPALIPVTHYVPRLLAELEEAQAQTERMYESYRAAGKACQSAEAAASRYINRCREATEQRDAARAELEQVRAQRQIVPSHLSSDYLSQLEAFCVEWLEQNQGCDLIDHGFGPDHGGELTTNKLLAALNEVNGLRDEVGRLTGDLLRTLGERDAYRRRFVEAWRAVQAEATADPAEFGIVALHACDIRSTWIQVHHVPCAEVVYGHADDTENTDAGELLARMAAHRCAAEPKPTDISQVFDVAVDGGTVTAAVHGSRPLDAQEQQHMAEVVRAGIRAEREKRREEARQRDEDVRAVAEACAAETGTPMELIRAVRTLRERFADRIADVRRRDAEAEKGPESHGDSPTARVGARALSMAEEASWRGSEGDGEAES